MTKNFENYILSHADLTREELDRVCALSLTKKLRKRQLLLKEGEVCLYKVFVSKGLLRSYRVKDDGTEHIMRFSPENNWTADRESLAKKTPSRINIEALEETEVVLWTDESLNQLVDTIPAFKAFCNKLMENALDESHERILMNISATSEEKYHMFINSFPDVFRRIPLHMVASYLGVSRETLSRIRHADLKQEKYNDL